MSSSYVHLDNVSLINLLHIQRNNLQQLELQSASYGSLAVPVHIINQIRQIKIEITIISTELQRRGYTIEANSGANQSGYEPKKKKNFTGMLGLTIALVLCLAAIVAIPEVRQLLNLDKGSTSSTTIPERGKNLVSPTGNPVQLPIQVNPQPSGKFTVRSFIYNQDKHIPRILEGVQSKFSNVPSRNVYNLSLSNMGPFVIENGWCAKSSDILSANLRRIDMLLLVNDTIVDNSLLSSSYGRDQLKDVYCFGNTGVISFSDKQEYRITTIIRIKEGLNDGLDEYPAGEYIEEYIVTVP